jgi:hypothetical protein
MTCGSTNNRTVPSPNLTDDLSGCRSAESTTHLTIDDDPARCKRQADGQR